MTSWLGFPAKQLGTAISSLSKSRKYFQKLIWEILKLASYFNWWNAVTAENLALGIENRILQWVIGSILKIQRTDKDSSAVSCSQQNYEIEEEHLYYLKSLKGRTRLFTIIFSSQNQRTKGKGFNNTIMHNATARWKRPLRITCPSKGKGHTH